MSPLQMNTFQCSEQNSKVLFTDLGSHIFSVYELDKTKRENQS